MIIQFVSFCVIMVAAFMLPWWALILGMGIYCRQYLGLELVVGMMLVDAYFGTLQSSPYLTGAAIVVVGIMQVLRPRLRAAPKFL